MPLKIREEAVSLVREACAQGSRKHKACELLCVTVRTLERWEKEGGLMDKREKAVRRVGNKLSKEERQHVLAVANSKEYADLPPCKIVPLLADDGIYIASESSFYRILRQEKLLSHRQQTRPATQHRPTPYDAYGANQVWSWDITYLPTQAQGLYFYLYVVMDVYSRKIVGFSLHEHQSADYGALLIQQACVDEKVEIGQVVLHSDNGTPMKGATMLAMLERLGVMPSFSRPSVSDDNPYSEALFKTVKYHPTFPMVNRFETLSKARAWSEEFVNWYNNTHLHSSLKFVTPNKRHTGEDKPILANRKVVYEKAKEKTPERWSGQTRNWSLPESVSLNPNRKNKPTRNEKITEFKRAA